MIQANDRDRLVEDLEAIQTQIVSAALKAIDPTNPQWAPLDEAQVAYKAIGSAVNALNRMTMDMVKLDI